MDRFTEVWRWLRSRWMDLFALAALVGMALWLFREHLLHESLFIGDADRLNIFLNVPREAIEAFRQGRVSLWDDSTFLGWSLLGVPAIFPTPLLYVAPFGAADPVWVMGIATCVFLVAAGWVSYGLFKDTCGHPFSALVGAALYQFSGVSVLQASQSNWGLAMLIYVPLSLLVLRRIQPTRNLGSIVGLMPLVALFLVALQVGGYALVFAATYALYRSVWQRRLEPMRVASFALVGGLVLALPPLYARIRELLMLQRTPVAVDGGHFDSLYEFQNIRPRELLRWLSDGVFGRFPAEAAALGNNINLHEGFLLYTSTFAALLMLVGLVRFRGEWFRLIRFRDEDLSFHVWALLLTMAVIGFKPVLYVVYVLFLKVDFTHARIVLVTITSQCLLVTVLLREVIGPGAPAVSRRMRGGLLLVAATVAVGALWTINDVSQRPGPTAKLAASEPWSYLAGANRQLLVSGAVSGAPPPPAGLAAEFVEPTTIEIGWQDGVGETGYQIEMRRSTESAFVPIGGTGANRTVYRVGNVAAGQPYLFRVQACRMDECSSYSDDAHALPGQVGPGAQVQRPSGPETWLLATEILRVEWSALVFVILVGALWVNRNRPLARWVLGHGLGFLMVLQVLSYADFQINGAHTRTDVPFEGNNFLTARAQEFKPPEPAALAALRGRLETDDYRAVLVCDPERFPAYCAPHLAPFWQLRVVEGYKSGVPARLAQLCWSDGVLRLRALSFSSLETLPWPLLAFLNVKYAIVVDDAFYRNAVASDGPDRGARPESVTIQENPLPAVPRHFFAAAVTPVADAEEAVSTLFGSGQCDGAPPAPTQRSVVEGVPGATTFSTGGEIRARYQGDVIDFEVDAAREPRFLVLNERYHPDWRAYAGGQELPVYPTNVVMRGVVIPPSVTQVRLRFQPVARPSTFLPFSAAGGVILLGVVWVGRRIAAAYRG